jgi:Ca2+-binding RTX toxin-like protein
LTVSKNGTYQFRVTDAAGNVTTQDVVVDKIDKVIVPQNPQTSADSLSWQGTRYADSYQVDLSTGGSDNTLSFNTSGTGVDIYSSAENTFNWQVSADGGESVPGNDIVTNAADPQKHSSVENGLMDLFIAGSSGIWEKDYVAMHLGTVSGGAGTNEFVELSGKNILADFFEGSEDANILIMTDDANGDALFVDDIYTALPEMVSEPQSRIARIDEIRAGNGDDIVDMTSQVFAYSGDGVKIYGGLGNDTIWANVGQNTLFGDAGNDRLVGGSDADVIIGGSGNDSMHGGGGNDIFCFGGAWGQDTVEQFDGGSVTLWFENGSENNWDASTLTYTDGGKSVTVSGVSTVTLKFGDVDSAVAGAFLDAASENIFEDKDRGMLA